MTTESPSTAIELFPKRAPSTLTTEAAAVARAAQEVQAAMVIAKRFPRDETAAYNRIVQACKRQTLAECACYAYPRGGTTVTGPSIRLAETVAQNWGNIDFGVVELSQEDGESQVMAYAWDLETNTRQTKIFTVKHERKAQGQIKRLDDPRDIYEMVANQGARRLRACILGVVPGDVIDAAVDQCEQTLKSGSKEPLIDRVRKMVAAFSEMAITQAMIEQRLNHKIDVVNETELVQLRKIFQSMRDGMSARVDWFKEEPARPEMPATANQTAPPLPAAGTATAPHAETDDGDLGPQAEEPAPARRQPTGPSPNHIKAIRGLLKLANKTDADLLKLLREAEKIDVSLSSLEEVADLTPSALHWAYEHWKTVLKGL